MILFNKDAFLQSYIGYLDQLLRYDQGLSVPMQQLKLEELLLYLSEYYPGKLEKRHTISQQTDDELRIRQAVSASIDQPLTVEELAFLCHTSLSTFKRRFTKLYGNSPNKWLLEKRMQKAALLLRQGDHKATEI